MVLTPPPNTHTHTHTHTHPFHAHIARAKYCRGTLTVDSQYWHTFFSRSISGKFPPVIFHIENINEFSIEYKFARDNPSTTAVCLKNKMGSVRGKKSTYVSGHTQPLWRWHDSIYGTLSSYTRIQSHILAHLLNLTHKVTNRGNNWNDDILR